MNKFKYLQWVGTTIVFSPVIALSATAFVYEIVGNESEDTITIEVVEVKDETKKDSVVKEVVVQAKPKPTPPTPKPVVKDTLPKPVVETKDSVEVKLDTVKVKLNTTLKIN
jgi:hypothetical protein